MANSSRVPDGAQPPPEQNEPVHVSVSAKEILIHCARESFDPATLRDLGEAFIALAEKKEGRS